MKTNAPKGTRDGGTAPGEPRRHCGLRSSPNKPGQYDGEVAATSVELPPTRALPSSEALRQRLVPPFPGSRLWGWLGPLAITLIAGYLRFNRLSVPGGKADNLATLCNAAN